MKNIIYISALFVLLLQISCNKDDEEDVINQDINLTLLYEEDFTSGIHKVFNQNNWAGFFTDTGVTYGNTNTPTPGIIGYYSMSRLQTPDNSTYGASITFRFMPTTGTGSFGLVFTKDANNNGGTAIMVTKSGYASIYDSRGDQNFLTRLGSGGLFYVGHLMDGDEDITLLMGVNDKYIAYYVNGHKVYEHVSFNPNGRYCGFYSYPYVSVNVKRFRTYD